MGMQDRRSSHPTRSDTAGDLVADDAVIEVGKEQDADEVVRLTPEASAHLLIVISGGVESTSLC